jgi:phosphoribosylanthranilate isomerase
MELKVCCIQSMAEAEMALAAGATALGLVAEMPSGPGPIPDEVIALICEGLMGRTRTVLLTSETSVEGVVSHVDRIRPSAVQLVDRVTTGVIPALRLLHPGVEIIEVVHVTGPESIDEAQSSRADIVLLDSGRAGSGVLGGTGQTHDWTLSAQIVERCSKPVWLAGGLNPDNLADAITAVRPAGVDVCSGLRTDGALDDAKLSAFTQVLRDNT